QTHRWRVRVLQALRLLLDGRFDEAESSAAEALRLGAGLEDEADGQPAVVDVRAVHALQMVACHHERGTLGAASHLQGGLSTGPRPLILRTLLALLWLENGRTAQAR